MKKYRTGWISDLHLGTKGSSATRVLDFLRDHDFETLYLVGDIIDVWALQRKRYWPQEHNDVIQKLLRKGRKGSRVIYITGNHDEFVDRFFGEYGAVTIQEDAIHELADGRRLLVIHGDELDTVIRSIGWLAHIGDIGYKLLLPTNKVINFFRRWFGMGYWSLSAYVKNEVKNVVKFIGNFEESVAGFAHANKADAVLCGHIHTAAMRRIGDIDYYNCGDWVESCTAIVENEDGTLELLDFNPHKETADATTVVEEPIHIADPTKAPEGEAVAVRVMAD